LDGLKIGIIDSAPVGERHDMIDAAGKRRIVYSSSTTEIIPVPRVQVGCDPDYARLHRNKGALDGETDRVSVQQGEKLHQWHTWRQGSTTADKIIEQKDFVRVVPVIPVADGRLLKDVVLLVVVVHKARLADARSPIDEGDEPLTSPRCLDVVAKSEETAVNAGERRRLGASDLPHRTPVHHHSGDRVQVGPVAGPIGAPIADLMDTVAGPTLAVLHTVVPCLLTGSPTGLEVGGTGHLANLSPTDTLIELGISLVMDIAGGTDLKLEDRILMVRENTQKDLQLNVGDGWVVKGPTPTAEDNTRHGCSCVLGNRK